MVVSVVTLTKGWTLQRAQIKTKKTNKKVVLKGSKMLPPKKAQDMYVTVKHLNAVEAKLSIQLTSNSEDIRHLNKRVDSLKSEISSKFAKVDMRFDKLENQMNELERKMEQGFTELRAILNTIMTKIHRTEALSEEQNSRNLFVLDGYAHLISEQQKIRRRMDTFEALQNKKGP